MAGKPRRNAKARQNSENNPDVRFSKDVDKNTEKEYNNSGDDEQKDRKQGVNQNELRENGSSRELGRLDNSSETEGFDEVGRLGQIQREKPNTPHTKSIRRSGVSAEGKTSSGLTAEQASIKEQNKIDGYATEFYKEAKLNGKEKSKMFRTKNTIFAGFVNPLLRVVFKAEKSSEAAKKCQDSVILTLFYYKLKY